MGSMLWVSQCDSPYWRQESKYDSSAKKKARLKAGLELLREERFSARDSALATS